MGNFASHIKSEPFSNSFCCGLLNMEPFSYECDHIFPNHSIQPLKHQLSAQIKGSDPIDDRTKRHNSNVTMKHDCSDDDVSKRTY
jgi:hypothetical protein